MRPSHRPQRHRPRHVHKVLFARRRTLAAEEENTGTCYYYFSLDFQKRIVSNPYPTHLYTRIVLQVVRHSSEPQFRQTLKYQACDVLGRSLVVMLWERQGGFEHNQGLGGAEVALDSLTLTHLTTGWYPLFPIHSLGSDSNDSP